MKVLLLSFLISTAINAKILRLGKQFEAKFTLVDANQRIKSNGVGSLSNTNFRRCVKACVLEVKCVTFNHNEQEELCELLSISKFDDVGLLKYDHQWNHYETSDDVSTIGQVCARLSPCRPFQVCEDTLEDNSQFRCRCKDGFEGEQCEIYKGPGTNENKPAPSCRLLTARFEEIPTGHYWIKGQGKQVLCEGRTLNRWYMQLDETSLKQNHLLRTLDLFGSEFVIEFYYKTPTLPADFKGNIIYFSASEVERKFKPAVNYRDKKLIFKMTEIDRPIFFETKMVKDKWVKVRVQQVKKSDGQSEYSIYLNDLQQFTRIHKDDADYENVKVYASNPFIVAAPGYIKNFVVYQPDLCKSYLCKGTCSSSVGTFTCSENCLIEVLGTDGSGEFYFSKLSLRLFEKAYKMTLRIKNLRSNMRGVAKLYSVKAPSQPIGDSYGRIGDNTIQVGDLYAIEDQSYCTQNGVSWDLQKSNLKYETKDNKYGKFNVKKSGLLFSIKLEYVDGFIEHFNTKGKNIKAIWGSHTNAAIRIMITNSKDEQILPINETFTSKKHHYYIEGYHANSPTIYLRLPILNPIKVQAGDELRLWSTNDFFEKDFGTGIVTCNVYAIIL